MKTESAKASAFRKLIGTVWLAFSLLLLVSLLQASPILAQQPVYNTAFLTDAQLEDYNSMNADGIRAFLVSKDSYFKQSIQDVDGQTFDPAVVIAQAASQYRISPKVILATLEKESNGVTRTTRPSDTTMRFLMGCISSNTARQQLTCAAERFRAYHNQLINNGSTVSGWRVGTPKTTQDGVSVTPATKAVAGQFTYTPYAGVQWGGNQSSVGGVYLFYYAWNKFDFGGSTSCPVGQYRAEYYNNRSLSGSPTLTRCEGGINYDWGSGGPGNGVGSDNFSVRWTGRHNFNSGNYTFIARSDDGIRVWVDGNLIIDAWRDQGPTEYRASRSPGAGEHEIKVEYYENGGGALAQFRWELASVTCPNQYKAEYFNNRSLSGSPTFVRCENWPINSDWGGGGPGNGVGNDNFSARWTGRAHINSGNYNFIARADDGVRVWVGGNLLIDAWRDQGPTEYRVTRYINNGDYDIKVEYYENGGGAVAQFRWEQASVSCPNQYKAEYFNNRSLSGSPTFVRCENWPINSDWGGGGPGNGVGNDNFSARWTGRAHINSGNYNFIARADDGVRVWVGGNLLIDAWRDQGPTEYRVTRYINNGDYDIKVEYYENGGGAVAQFRWEQASSGGSYNRLVARHSGRCMDVYGASRDNGAANIQWDCHSGDNQLWSLVPAGGDYYKLVAKHSGKCLDVYGASRDNGARLIQWECHGGDNQLFKREQVGSYYRLRAKHSNRCVDVYGGQRDNGVRLIQWDCHSGDNQLWVIQSRTAATQDEGDGLGVQPAAAEYILPIGDAAVIARIAHTVQEGDSLALMAGVYDVSVATILEANPELADASAVQPGMTLYVPLSVPYGEAKRLYLPAVLR